MPVGKPNPINSPDGTIAASATIHAPEALRLERADKAGNQYDSSTTNRHNDTAHPQLLRCIQLQPFRDQTADAGCKNYAEQPDGKSVDRMTKEQRHPLDDADLDEHKAEAYQREIERPQPGKRCLRTPDRGQAWQDHGRQYKDRRHHDDYADGLGRFEVAADDAVLRFLRAPDRCQIG
jgi:hypothetical protein